MQVKHREHFGLCWCSFIFNFGGNSIQQLNYLCNFDRGQNRLLKFSTRLYWKHMCIYADCENILNLGQSFRRRFYDCFLLLGLAAILFNKATIIVCAILVEGLMGIMCV